MKAKTSAAALLLLLINLPAFAFDLATSINQRGNTVSLESIGYVRLNLIKEETDLTGSIISTGNLSVTGAANIVMWVKVEGKYYYSKLPALQNIQNRDGFNFSIPFNASNKKATEVVIEVEMLDKGRVSISDWSVQKS